MKKLSGLLIVFVLGVPAAKAQGNDFEWRVQLPQGQVRPSSIEATNLCHKTHQFQVVPDSLPFMRLKGPSSFPVGPGGTLAVPVEFDTRNMKPGSSEALIVVKCLTCRTEKTCRQDHQNLHILLTVLAAAPNWSAIHPEQKESVLQSPALRWSSISPEQKPH